MHKMKGPRIALHTHDQMKRRYEVGTDIAHSIFRIHRGALGQLLVEGNEAPGLYKIKQKGSAVASNH